MQYISNYDYRKKVELKPGTVVRLFAVLVSVIALKLEEITKSIDIYIEHMFWYYVNGGE